MKKNLWKIILALVIIVVVASSYYKNEYLKNQNSDKISVNEAQVESGQDEPLLPGSTGRLMMMDLGSTGCVPCQMMEPILDELTREYQGRVDIQFVDVNERQEFADKYKIYAIPTQIFFDRSGKEVYRHEGFFAKEEIIKKLKQMGLD